MKCTFKRTKFEEGYFEGILILDTIFHTYIFDFAYHAAFDWLELYSCNSKRHNPKRIQYTTLQLMAIRKKYGKRMKAKIQRYLIKTYGCTRREGVGLYFSNKPKKLHAHS